MAAERHVSSSMFNVQSSMFIVSLPSVPSVSSVSSVLLKKDYNNPSLAPSGAFITLWRKNL